jgi:hypothetical protein
MSDSLDKYLPEFDEEEIRGRLAGSSTIELTNMLILAYKEKRVLAKIVDDAWKKLDRIKQVAEEPSSLLSTPGIPTAEDLRRMMGEDDLK